jgi:hypothetical protein
MAAGQDLSSHTATLAQPHLDLRLLTECGGETEPRDVASSYSW